MSCEDKLTQMGNIAFQTGRFFGFKYQKISGTSCVRGVLQVWQSKVGFSIEWKIIARLMNSRPSLQSSLKINVVDKKLHLIVHVLTWYFIFEWSFFSTNTGVNSILLAWLCFLKYKTLQHSVEVLENLCRHSKYLFLAPILITWLVLSNDEIHVHVSCVTFKWFLFQESDNELLRRDVEFSITTLKTCELVSPTILKVSHQKCCNTHHSLNMTSHENFLSVDLKITSCLQLSSIGVV